MRVIDARVAKLELNAPQSRNVIVCTPCTHEPTLMLSKKISEGIYQHGYGENSINYTSRELLDAYLATQDKSARIYSILTPDDVTNILDKIDLY